MCCKLFFAGDVVLSENKYGDQIFSADLLKIIKSHDIACCNIEAPIQKGYLKKKLKIGPNISQTAENIQLLKDAGFNLATIANNHIFDFGLEGIKATFSALEGMMCIGAGLTPDTIYKPLIKIINEIKFGFLAVAENGFGAAIEDDSYGYAYMCHTKVRTILQELAENCDFVVITCHAGAEHWDVPLPEIRELYRRYIDWGANVVVAHHPHVVQGWESYKKGTIFYSLGNFAFDKGNGPQNGEAFCVSLHVNKNGEYTHDVLCTRFENGMISLNESTTFKEHIKECNKILEQERYKEYLSKVEKMCLQAFQSIYKGAYGKVNSFYRGGVRECMKGLIKRYVMRNKFQEIWLYHNITIETHLWICKRALRKLLKEKEIL